jgi:predicted DNA-binding transcriptional regulator YafY
MSNTTSRALRLLSLLQAHQGWSGAELAQRLGVSQRTIRRDIDRLRELGYPVTAVTGVTGGYRLEAGAAMPPLLLDDDEAVAIAVGLRTAAGGTVAGLQETSVRALTKLEQVLPPRLRRQVNALHTYTEALVTSHSPVDPQALTAISRACRDRERVRFDYHSRDQTPSTRLVEPFRLVAVGRRWYLLAWDVHRGDWRTFRVDRMAAISSTGTMFAPRQPPGDGAAAFVRDNITARLARFCAVVTLHAPQQTVAERIRVTEGYSLQAIDDHSCLMRTEADSLEWLALSIGSLGFEFDVHEPPELVDFVRDLAQRLVRSTRVADGGAAVPS